MPGSPTTFRALAVGATFRFPGSTTICRKTAPRRAIVLHPDGLVGHGYTVGAAEPVVLMNVTPEPGEYGYEAPDCHPEGEPADECEYCGNASALRPATETEKS